MPNADSRRASAEFADICARRGPARARPAMRRLASDPGGPQGTAVSVVLQAIVKRRERTEVDAQRGRDQPIGEPGVLRQQRAMQVGADRVAAPGALESAVPVVAEAAQDPSQG